MWPGHRLRGVGGQVLIPALGQFTAQHPLELGGFARALCGRWPGSGSTRPRGWRHGRLPDGTGRRRPGGFQRVRSPNPVADGSGCFLLAQSSTVHTGRVGLVGRAVADGGGHLDDRRLVGHGLGGLDRLGDGINIGVAFGHVLNVPP